MIRHRTRPPDPLLAAVARIRAELNAGRLGHAVVILRDYSPEDRERIAELLDRPARRHKRGQALVEFALVLPILMTIIGGGLVIGLAVFERVSLEWAAQEASYAAAVAPSDADRCQAALDALLAVSGRPYASCTGSDGATLGIEPGPPRVVRVRLTGTTWQPPLLAPVTVAADAAAVIR